MDSRDITGSLSYYLISSNLDENKLEKLILSQLEMEEEELTNDINNTATTTPTTADNSPSEAQSISLNRHLNHHEEEINHSTAQSSPQQEEIENPSSSEILQQQTNYNEEIHSNNHPIIALESPFVSCNSNDQENAPTAPQQQEQQLTEDNHSPIRNPSSITARTQVDINTASLTGSSTSLDENFETKLEKTTQHHIMQRKIEPIITETGLVSPSSPSLNPAKANFKIKDDICSPTISTTRAEDFQFTVVEIQTTVTDVKSPSPISNCFYFMRKCTKKVDKILICIIVSTLILSCFLLAFPIPLISVGTFYLQSSKFESSTDSDSNSLIFTRFPCFVVGKSKCNTNDGELAGTSFRVTFPSFLRDLDQNSTNQSTQASTGKTRTLPTSSCYSSANQYVEEKEYICYTNRDESKVSLTEPSSQNSNYYTNVGFQLLLFGVIGLIASVCIVVSICCTSWILIEHKPWKSSSLTAQDQVIKEATTEAQAKEKSEIV